jgi:DNA-binding response OmpR family regulator
MINALLASSDKAHFSNMIAAFQSHNIQIDPVQKGSLALTMVAESSYNLLITDEDLSDMSGKTLIERTISLNPFMNCVVVSRLSHKDFHEEFEGLGVLMQFPLEPGTTDVQKLLDHLGKKQ